MTDLERLVHENAQLNRQVTDLQRRCTELLEEKRRANVDYAVREFHLKYGHPAPAELTVPDEAMIRFRAKIVTEEYLELLDAMFAAYALPEWESVKRDLQRVIETAPVEVDMVEWADATHDLDYVVAGTRIVFGYDGLPGAAEVHRSNLSKMPNGLGKPTKPEGWTPPDIEGVLKAQGFERLKSDAGAFVDLVIRKAPVNEPPPANEFHLKYGHDKGCRPGVCLPGCAHFVPAPEDDIAAKRTLLHKAALGLRKLAAKYPEPPPVDECGEQSRVYYQHLAHQLDIWAECP
jgi:predicted HAD superfamily Cof-like phosphohydrolase